MFSDIRRGLLAVPAGLTRIAETVGRDSYDQLAARYLTGQAEGLGQEIKGLSIWDALDRPNTLLQGATTLGSRRGRRQGAV
jgi:hypothetical protein